MTCSEGKAAHRSLRRIVCQADPPPSELTELTELLRGCTEPYSVDRLSELLSRLSH